MVIHVARSLVRWTVFALVLTILFHVAATYASTTIIDVGERPAATFLLNFWEAERSPDTTGNLSYQWSTDSSIIDLPTFKTAHPWTFMLRGWTEPTINREGVWLAVEEGSVHLPATSGIRSHQLLLPHLAQVSLLRAAPDPDPLRNVGFATDVAEVRPITRGMALDEGLLSAAILVSAFLAFVVYAAGMDRKDTLLMLIGSAGLASFVLATHPLYALRAIPSLIYILATVLPIALCSFLWFSRTRHYIPGYIIAALAVIVVLKAIGIFYPNYIGVDTSYHIRGLEDVIQGRLYRIGGGAGNVFPYPPGVYVFLAPFTLLFGHVDWVTLQWLVLGSSIVIDSSTILLLNHILGHRLVNQQVRHWAALLYICLPAGFILFWHATVAQNIGQWFLIAYVTALVSYINDQRRLTPARIGFLVFLSLLASLGHFGVFLNFNLMFTLLVLLFPRFALQYRPIIATWVIGTVLSIVLYYTVFWSVIADEIRKQVEQNDQVPTRWFVFERFVWSLGIRDHYLGIYVVAAMIGVVSLLWLKRAPYLQVLARVFGAMLLASTLLGLLQVIILFNPTRYIIFSHTAIVIFSAFALGFLTRYRASWIITRALICVTLIWSLLLWASAFALHANRAWLS